MRLDAMKTPVKSPPVSLTINGRTYTVDDTVRGTTSLNDFLRLHVRLPGTKKMCNEGGCGVCVVSVEVPNPSTGVVEPMAVNSCLVPVRQCNGWVVTTVEGVGNRKDGYSSIQTRLATGNGTQCGFCSPGMVMSMYSLLKSNPEPLLQHVEDSFDGNICRCTGYRPILDSFKSFAVDAPSELRCSNDIEDLGSSWCKKKQRPCNGTCDRSDVVPLSKVEGEGSPWYYPRDLQELRVVLRDIGQSKYRVVVGNTGAGVYKHDGPYDAYISVAKIGAFYEVVRAQDHVTFGAAVSMTKLAVAMKEIAESRSSNFGYLGEVSKHIYRVANVPVRNAGSWSGNLMMKQQHPDFISDLFILFEAAKAKIKISHHSYGDIDVTSKQLLSRDMQGWVITSASFPSMPQNTVFRSYKIMPRSQNAHAFINAAFLLNVDRNDNYRIGSKPNLVFGGLSAQTIHAVEAENYLTGKQLGDKSVLQQVLSILASELKADDSPPLASPEYREKLAVRLFYKFVLNLVGSRAAEMYRSGGTSLTHPLSKGHQTFDTDESVWPLNKPIPKAEALAQCSGEAEYVDDVADLPGEVHGAFVTTTVGNATLKSINSSAALEMPGVIAVLTAEDIPGYNSFVDTGVGSFTGFTEEVLCSDQVLYAGQPVALVVAETDYLAHEAARAVTVEYKDVKKPLLTIKDVLNDEEAVKTNVKPDPFLPEGLVIGDTKVALESSSHQIEGEFFVGGQFHFSMETQVSRAIPTEDGLTVLSATQDIASIQAVVSQLINLPKNKIAMSVRRLGGAYGAKISRCGMTAAGSALIAHVLNRPARVKMDLETNMEALGGRVPTLAKYKVGIDSSGKLKSVTIYMYSNVGCSMNEMVGFVAASHVRNCYTAEAWHILPQGVLTNTPSTTWCRAPGSTEGVAIMEHIMEHVAYYISADALAVRELNFEKPPPPEKSLGTGGDDGTLLTVVAQLKENAELRQRKTNVIRFNQANRWKKRGLSVVPMKYGIDYMNFRYTALVSIYKGDGTVVVAHGGIEMGQGINTKAIQACAYELGIPEELVSIRPANNLTSPNDMVTGGAIGSELNCQAVVSACRVLNQRMAPIREKLDNPTWVELVNECHQQNINLSASHMYNLTDQVKGYEIWGAVATEVEVDMLTGETLVTRVDLIEDTGRSISPLVDVGQVEGAFVMGLGLWLSEVLKYDVNTGQNLTTGTWEYKPPTTKDIPADFRVTLLQKSENPFGVLKSKATGEPPLCLSVSVLFAIREAVKSARYDVGNYDWFKLDGAATPEKVGLAALINLQDLTFGF